MRNHSVAMQAQCQFPGGKKAEAKAGESLKAVAAKARYDAPYGCEEGKCGTCEHKVGGKKVRRRSWKATWCFQGCGREPMKLHERCSAVHSAALLEQPATLHPCAFGSAGSLDPQAIIASCTCHAARAAAAHHPMLPCCPSSCCVPAVFARLALPQVRLCIGKVPAGDGPHVFTQ
jgi:2Fe-2S iron-sulfur cluster binding domain